MAERESTNPETESRERAAPPPAPPEARYPPAAVPKEPTPQARTPLLAAIFSLFPGLGNVYNGLYLRGITFFLIIVGLIALANGTRPPEAVFLVFSVIFVWLFNIFDAYRQATFINYGYTPDLDWPSKPRRFGSWGSGGLVAGVAVFLIGFYGLLRETLDIDLSILADYWYVLFMAFGAFLIARTVIDKKRLEEDAGADEAPELEGA